MPKHSEFGKARRAYLATAKKAGHEMRNPLKPWTVDNPWAKDESDVYHSECGMCSYEVQTFQSTQAYDHGKILIYHFSRIDAGQVNDLTSMPVKCSGKD